VLAGFQADARAAVEHGGDGRHRAVRAYGRDAPVERLAIGRRG
jgi:hypothetical protein